jgi:hypothetical protein
MVGCPTTQGLCGQVHDCGGGTPTSISGTIYDPAGKNPLYNIVAYVPNTTPDPLKPGASCYTCDSLYTGEPIATALTGPDGKFTIQNVPDGANIPLVVQIGKWRNQFVIPNVAQCQDNQVPDKTLRLPRNHMEGDIPSIGIATGGADSLECLLKRIGVDEAEYVGGAAGDGRIHVFQGDNGANTNPPAPVASQSMWDSQADLMNYDIVILSCEGHEATNMNQQALFDYAANGGRAFASHFHYSWFNTGPFATYNLSQWQTGANPITMNNTDVIGGVIQTTLSGGQPFPKGQAMQQWLANVNALGVNGAPAGELPIQEAKHNSNVTAANTNSTVWIVADQNAPRTGRGATQYFSFDTPLDKPSDQQCGRVVYSDLHVGSAVADYNGALATTMMGGPVNGVAPSGCLDADLSPQEKALEFMLFDLSACITPNGQAPAPPGKVQ